MGEPDTPGAGAVLGEFRPLRRGGCRRAGPYARADAKDEKIAALSSMPTMTYQICTRCIMDTSDPDIEFDAAGVCNHCRNFDQHLRPQWHPDEHGRRMLDALVARIKREGRAKLYDCA